MNVITYLKTIFKKRIICHGRKKINVFKSGRKEENFFCFPFHLLRILFLKWPVGKLYLYLCKKSQITVKAVVVLKCSNGKNYPVFCY